MHKQNFDSRALTSFLREQSFAGMWHALVVGQSELQLCDLQVYQLPLI